MSKKWTVEAFVYGRRIEVTSDGTEEGTTYICDRERDGKSIAGSIHYGEEFYIAYDGMKVKSAYTPLGIMAAIAGIEIHQAIFTKVPLEARQQIDAYYAPQQELRKRYPDIVF
jgi:hypothetical protein